MPIADAAPQIDDFAAVAIHSDSSAYFMATPEVAAKCVGNFFVALINVAADEL